MGLTGEEAKVLYDFIKFLMYLGLIVLIIRTIFRLLKWLYHAKVWWKCKNGHEWEAVIHTRVKGVGCPYCMGKKAIQGKAMVSDRVVF